ncbi:MAG: hypothetical protein LBC80_04365 [Treponema sp.]|jgi:hypothetical protein|nr:hypothetical protein [Treponema sp.]
MRIKTLFFLIFFSFSTILGAQTVHDPNGELYRDIDIWFVRGYITESLPMIRPYPVKLITVLLEQVIENGDLKAQEKAAFYMEVLAPGSRFLHPGIMSYIQGNEKEHSTIIAPFIEGLFHINPRFNVSYNYSVFGLSDGLAGEDFNVPWTYSPYPDIIDDWANIGEFKVLQSWTSLVAFGTTNVYLQAGLSRTSFGPFYDNGIIVGPQAPRAGHFSFVYRQPVWSFEVLFQTLTATDDFGDDRFPSKYNIIHAFNVRPVKALELGIVQTLTYGERIEPLYFVPFTFLFMSQAVYGFYDNAFIGLYFRWRPFNTFIVNGQVYIDDFHFNSLLTGVIKTKSAGEIGISWTPEKSLLTKLDFDYTAVLPYTYTHRNQPERHVHGIPNYLNYTHMGRNIGPDLQPNSDRFSLRTFWNILSNVDVNVSAYFTRHGNASAEHEPRNGKQDGSVFDDGYLIDDHLSYGFSLFLTQPVLDTRLGGTIGVNWQLPSSFGTFKLSGDYGIQYGWNRGLSSGNNGLDHFWSIGGKWTY